jgi:hypothetical protein
MTTKFIALISVIGFASTCLVQGQTPTPGESPAASPSPAEKAASPSPAESPTATPKEKPTPKKAKPKKAATPAAATTATPAAGGPGLVWVNTDTHVYHKQGSRFYGKTKNGKYVSEADARKEGNRPAAQEN